jgi:hypothetical protein
MKLNASSAVIINPFLHMVSLCSSLIKTKSNFVDNLDYPTTKIFIVINVITANHPKIQSYTNSEVDKEVIK